MTRARRQSHENCPIPGQPKSFDTHTDERGSSLSSGMERRLVPNLAISIPTTFDAMGGGECMGMTR